MLCLYKNYCEENNIDKELQKKYSEQIYSFVMKHSEEFNGILNDSFNIKVDNFIKEIQNNLLSKIKRLSKISKSCGKLSNEDILKNMEASLKSAFYMHFRYLYNYREELNVSKEWC